MIFSAAVAAVLTGSIISACREPCGGIAPDLPVHAVAPGHEPVQTDNSMNVSDAGSGIPPGYLLYDNFAEKNDDIWIVPSYKPNSDFIDTTFLPANVQFAGGNLILKSDVDRHLGAEYKTKEKFLYGKYRTSMRLEQTPGTYLTFFLYTPESGNHNEIDIELIKAGNVTKARLTTWVNMQKNERYFTLPFDPAKDYHLYGFDWYKDHVDFFIDDLETPLWTSTEHVPRGACYLYFNSWVVTKVPADHGDGQNTQYVDWVTVQPLDDGA
jgi:hypothetical protein